MKVRVVIPARMGASRLPGKPLLPIAGKPMLQHVFDRVAKAQVDSIIIATPDQEIINASHQFGAQTCLTSHHHCSGTQRIAQVIESKQYANEDIIINAQCDEPLLSPLLVNQLVDALSTHLTAVVSTASRLATGVEELTNSNVVKVVVDHNNYALYFSRSPVPWCNLVNHQAPLPTTNIYAVHIGLYAYRAAFIKRYVTLAPSPLETIEKLEQLRILYHGEKIHVTPSCAYQSVGVDTKEDWQALKKRMEA